MYYVFEASCRGTIESLEDPIVDLIVLPRALFLSATPDPLTYSAGAASISVISSVHESDTTKRQMLDYPRRRTE